VRTILAPRASTILHDLLLQAKPGRAFLLPANICPIVPITFFKAGVPIEFVDISPDTLNIDLDEVETRLQRSDRSYGGLLYAHTYGDPTTPKAWMQQVKGRFPDLLVIDDRCLCVPEFEPPASSPADAILYSTGYAKIVDIGSGGFAFIQEHVPCRHQSLKFRKADLASMEATYKACVESGERYSYQDTDWLQADGNLAPWEDYRQRVLAALQPSLEHRSSLNAVYNSRIPSELGLPRDFQLWRFNLRVPHKQQVLAAIFAAGLFASSHYASLDGIMGSGGGRNAREMAGQVINLFNDQHYTLEMAEKTAEIIKRNL
jgi:hypothetical protein